ARGTSASCWAVKPSFSARASSSFTADSTLGWFCGAKIADETHCEWGSTLSHSIWVRTPYDGPSASPPPHALPPAGAAAAAQQVVGHHQRRVVGIVVRQRHVQLGEHGRVLLV